MSEGCRAMSLEEKIVELLYEKIGFNPASVGTEQVLASVRASLKNRIIPDPAAYLNGLRSGNKDFNEIVNAVVIPETWFFRDGEPFELLKRHVASEWQYSAGKPLRCLSVPCSTGEEPYSIAMAVLDSGLAPGSFTVDGIDISSQSLQRAREGVYGMYSFRVANLAFRDRYFAPDANNFRLLPMVRDAVRFSQGNLLDPLFMYDSAPYDIIFCRNLLIYFDPPGWDLALKTLGRILKDSGLLFMGHAEALEFAAPQFESVRFPCAFAYRKRRAKEPVTKDNLARLDRPSETASLPRKTSRLSAPDANSQNSRVIVPSVAPPVPALMKDVLLNEARELADRGKSGEAALACEKFLALNPGNAEAYFLLGLIAETEGKTRDAEGYYNRALYLDSKHHEAMIHKALILEGRGDKDGAALLRQRAGRLRQAQ